MDILVPRKYSTREVQREELALTEFQPNPYTKGWANLDDMIALKKAVTLCPTHAIKFNPKAAHYMAHPEPKLSRVLANCDVCQQMGLSNLYLNGEDAENEHKKLERFKRALEYGTIIR